MTNRAGRALDAVLASKWAMEEHALRQLVGIAGRWVGDPGAIEVQDGEALDRDRDEVTTVRDGIATVHITGPLFRFANLFTRVSGATSYEILGRDITTALENDAIRAILLSISSPGGQVESLVELGDLIAAGRDQKPIVAHVSGMGASAAYWLASAAEQIIGNATAEVGSIGVQSVFLDRKARDEKDGFKEIRITSSQSPKKNLDPDTPEGRSAEQVVVDDLAAVFVGRVARFRGVSEDTVLDQYGQGLTFVGEAAVRQGMLDGIAAFETVHAELVARRVDRASSISSPLITAASAAGAVVMDSTDTPQTPQALADQFAADHPDAAALLGDAAAQAAREEGRAVGAAQERERIRGIQAIAAPGHETLITQCIEDADCTPETAALRMRHAELKAGKQHLTDVQADEEQLDAPDPAPSAETSEADRMAAAVLHAGRQPASATT